MTTVAFRDGVMACDTMCSWGGLKVESASKIYRLGDGMAGFAGSLGDIMQVLEWLRSDRSAKFPFKGDKNPDCILAFDTGMIQTMESGGLPVPVVEPFVAIGSGSAIAYGAFHMGASAKEAVEAAIRFDLKSGGRVNTLRLRPKK